MMRTTWVRWVGIVWAMLVPLFANAATPRMSTSYLSNAFLKADGTAWIVGNAQIYGLAVQPLQLFQSLGPLKAFGAEGTFWAITPSGDLYTLGQNWIGQAGVGHTDAVLAPTLIMSKVRSARGSWENTVAVREDGTVWAWGQNAYGTTGDGTRGIRTKPVQVPGLDHVIDAVTSWQASAALKDDGTVWSWGAYYLAPEISQPGYTEDDPRFVISPRPIPGLSDIVRIELAGALLALRRDGQLFAVGSFWMPQLGASLPPNTVAGVVAIPGLNDVVAVSGGNSAYAVRRDGTVWTWGLNSYGEQGTSALGMFLAPHQMPGISNAVDVSAGGFQVAIRLADGSVITLGNNSDGQLGNGDVLPMSVPQNVQGIAGVGNFNLLAATPSTINLPPAGQLTLSPTSGVAPQIVTASATNLNDPEGDAIASYLWRTTFDATATGSGASFTIPRAGSFSITLIVRDARGAASALRGEIYVAPPRLTTNTQPAVATNGYSGVGVSASGDMYGWGATWYRGLAGTSSSYSYPVPARVQASGVVDLAFTGFAGYARLVDGSVISWGHSEYGELGNGRLENSGAPTTVLLPQAAKGIAGGRFHGLALLTDGTVWSWGDGQYGQQGNGRLFSQPTPTQVPGLPSIKQIAAGWNSAFALDQTGRIWAWGENSQGELGLGDIKTRLVPTLVQGLPPMAQIFTGMSSVYAKTGDGRVFAWGAYRGAAPSEQPQLREFVTIWEWNDCALGLKADGSLWGWGDNNLLTCPPLNGDKNVTTPRQWIGASNPYSVALSWGSGLIVLNDGTVLSWGTTNFYGNLGTGTYAISTTPTNVIDPTGTAVLDLAPSVPNDPANLLLPYFLTAQKNGNDLSTTLTDLRANGFSGSVYFSGLVPSSSPLLKGANTFAAEGAMVPVSFGRGGVKQTGPAVAAESNFSGAITSGNSFAVYGSTASDPLASSNAIICMGVTIPALSAKGQVLMRAIANGDQDVGVTQCPTVQTEATTKLYTSQVSGTTSNRTIVARVQAQPEDYGQQRSLYSWAVAPDGRQFMQTGPNAWAFMSEPMSAAATVTVSSDGSPVTLPVVQNLDLSTLVGTLVYVGLGSSWAEVKQWNKAGHYWTVQ